MKLSCYALTPQPLPLRAASPSRDWMDRIPDRHAYRCLPLAIANAHGWEILSPCGFEARWTGGPGTGAVEIRLDPGTEPRRAPVSLFGQGTLTFHVEGLLRTPEGWNLWVGGSPNQAKDGIAPLGGVIETDWSPYTFTMNWRFTRADHWVRFEENEPFCFFFPIPRGAAGQFEPVIRPIDEEPGLRQAFDGWSKSRDDFQRWVAETRPDAPADKWQKLYYRGIRPDGAEGPADHEAKLRLEPFRQADGSAMTPAECPIRKPPVAPERTAAVQVSDAGLHGAPTAGFRGGCSGSSQPQAEGLSQLTKKKKKKKKEKKKKNTLTLPSPASGSGCAFGNGSAPLLPLAGEGWDEGLFSSFGARNGGLKSVLPLLAEPIQRDGRLHQVLERVRVDFLAFVDVDRAPGVAFQAGVEQARRVGEARALGEGELDRLLVRFPGADDAEAGPDRGAHPLPFLDDFGIGFQDQRAHPGQRVAAPVAELADPLVDQPGSGLAVRLGGRGGGVAHRHGRHACPTARPPLRQRTA
jgi:hypothetical protein